MNPKMRQYEEEKYIECSFRPSVNMISDQIVQVKRSIENPELSSSRNAHVNVHDSLYLQAGVLAEKKKQTAKDFIRQNYSFKPKLSKTSMDNFSSSSYRSLNFLQRQELSRASKQKKLEEIKMNQEKVDPKSGQLLFKPVINNSESLSQKRDLDRAANVSIETRLLEYSKIYDGRKKDKASEEARDVLQKTKPVINHKSKELLLNSHIETLVEIFGMLDGKKTNILSSKNFNDSEIPES
jgi:hypothetical protein